MDLYKTLKKAPVMKSVFVYEQMKEELINGKWNFGEKILVNALIERFNVSRRPVMEALKMLENDGFIQILPQYGCKVIDYSKKSALEVILLRSAIEGLCAEMGAKNHTTEEIESLENYQRMISLNPEKLYDKYFYLRYNREFHSHIALMAHSDKIREYTVQIWGLNDFYLVNLFDHFRWDITGSLEGHNKIVDAIKDRDGAKAKKLMEEHLELFIHQHKDRLPEM
ncbi:GntR family transcriptional regulator [Peribacillus sp. SCS-155]|uniref:GntR family transcriptional regulator n=1 Tax=Peribacillus sedimenti TaxID=3115297 RepID=UPI003906A2C3